VDNAVGHPVAAVLEDEDGAGRQVELVAHLVIRAGVDAEQVDKVLELDPILGRVLLKEPLEARTRSRAEEQWHYCGRYGWRRRNSSHGMLGPLDFSPSSLAATNSGSCS